MNINCSIFLIFTYIRIKSAGNDEVMGEMIKDGDDRVVEWIWRVFNMAFECGVVPDDWRFAVIVQL